MCAREVVLQRNVRVVAFVLSWMISLKVLMGISERREGGWYNDWAMIMSWKVNTGHGDKSWYCFIELCSDNSLCVHSFPNSLSVLNTLSGMHCNVFAPFCRVHILFFYTFCSSFALYTYCNYIAALPALCPLFNALVILLCTWRFFGGQDLDFTPFYLTADCKAVWYVGWLRGKIQGQKNSFLLTCIPASRDAPRDETNY
jgi:hypothetical protein